MPQRFQLKTRQTKLLEIRNIIHSMKTLAVLESRKLQTKYDYLLQMEQAMATLVDDFTSSFTDLNFVNETTAVLIVIGSERGFCGNFNDLVRAQALPKLDDYHQVYIIGTKLGQLNWPENSNCTKIAGAHVVEDVEAVSWQVLSDLLLNYQAAPKTVIAHDSIQEKVIVKPLYPPMVSRVAKNKQPAFDPVFNVPKTQFAEELAERYLIYTLQRVLYYSLMRENERRMIHLEKATDYLDEQNEKMLNRINELRQEEIIEEIEVILMRRTRSL